MAYAIAVLIIDTIIEKIKFCLNFNNKGSIIKKTNEGRDITIVLYDNSITFCASLVSQYNQRNASNEVNGSETIIAAVHVYLFAISDTTTMIIAVIRVFKIKYIVIK